MASRFTGEHLCQSELQGTVENRSLVAVGVAFDILVSWKNFHQQTSEYSKQVNYIGEVKTTTENDIMCVTWHQPVKKCQSMCDMTPVRPGVQADRFHKPVHLMHSLDLTENQLLVLSDVFHSGVQFYHQIILCLGKWCKKNHWICEHAHTEGGGRGGGGVGPCFLHDPNLFGFALGSPKNNFVFTPSSIFHIYLFEHLDQASLWKLGPSVFHTVLLSF